MKKIVIFGAGGMAKEVAMLIKDINAVKPEFDLFGFVVDDKYYKTGMEILGLPVFTRDWLVSHKKDYGCVCAIGYPTMRREVQEKLIDEGIEIVSLLHPTTRIGENTVIGYGCIMEPGCDISVDCVIGDGVFLNGNVNIGHDSVIGNYVTCFPKSQISGHVVIEDEASIGALSFINEKRRIGKRAVVAPGSFVFNNVKDGLHVLGNPAKRLCI